MDPPRFVNHYSALFRGMRHFGLATPWIPKHTSLWLRLPYLFWDTFLVTIVVYMLWCYVFSLMTIYIPFQDLFGLGISTTNYVCALSLTLYHGLFGHRIKRITDNIDAITEEICKDELGGAKMFHKVYGHNSKLMTLFTSLSLFFGSLLPFTYFLAVPVSDFFSGNYRSRFPVKINSPFDDREPWIYELILSIMSVCVSSSIGKKTATDCLFMSLFRIQTDLLKYLSKSMTTLQEEFNTGNRVLFRGKLIAWIKLHQAIVKNIQKLVLYFSPVIIIYYVSVIGNVVCAMFIQLKKDNDSLFQSIMMSVYVMVSLAYLFLLSDFADQLTTEAQKLAFMAYSGPWYEGGKSDADMMRLVVTVSNRPLEVTAYRAPVFLLNRKTFIGFVTTAMSTFLTFSKMKDGYGE